MNDKVKIKLLFFAKARELTGKEEDFVEVSQNIKGADLLDSLASQFNLNSIRQNLIIALNEDWVDLNSLLQLNNGDEVAILPPLSGVHADRYSDPFQVKIEAVQKNQYKPTMNHVRLTNDKLNVERIYNIVRSAEYGAISVFIGTTRNNSEGKSVEKLEYEAYDKMAVKSLEDICKKVREKYDIGHIAIFHRLGDVPVEEASVVIAMSAIHRRSVFEALSFAADCLKAEVPIWKKEVYEGELPPQWKENAECTGPSATDTSDLFEMREETVETDYLNQIPPELIQINASHQEIKRRLKSCMDSRRMMANLSNVEDFCLRIPEEDKDSTCARTNAFVFRRKDSKSHLRVQKVENTTGPQVTSDYEIRTQLPEPATDTVAACPPGAEERLANAETFLNIKNDSANVFARLKAIEDKILYLETISPEYFDFARQIHTPKNPSMSGSILKKTYSSEDIDMKLCDLKSHLKSRSNLQKHSPVSR